MPCGISDIVIVLLAKGFQERSTGIFCVAWENNEFMFSLLVLVPASVNTVESF